MTCQSLARRAFSFGFAICFVFIMGIATVEAAELFVSPGGDDMAAGTKNQPLATLERALALVAQQGGGGTIWMLGGDYPLRKGLKLDKRHSGNEASPLRIAAVEGEEVRLHGGLLLSGFGPILPEDAKLLLSPEVREKVFYVNLTNQEFTWKTPGDRYVLSGGPELFVGDKRMTLARWPNEGFAEIAKVVDHGRDENGTVVRPGVFTIDDDRPAKWNLDRGVWLSGYWCHDWSQEVLRVESFDAESKKFQMKGIHNYGIGPTSSWNREPRRFFAVDLFEELDKPGEWYLDRERGRLFVYPPAPMEAARVVLSMLAEPLITITGASHVEIQGITLETSRQGAVVMKNCEKVVVHDCLIRNLGSTAVSIRGGENCGVVKCEIADVGSTGISINAGDRKSLTPGLSNRDPCI